MGWKSVRVVGNLAILKVSYFALVAIPFASNFVGILEGIGFSRLQMMMLYFSSFSLAIANLLYDVFCPPIIKRFESPNDLYRDMLTIKEKSVAVYPNDKFIGDYKHAVDAYRRKDASRPWVFWPTMALFISSVCMFGGLVLLRTGAFIQNLSN